MAAVKLRGVTKRFGSVVALDQFSLDIDDGEFMVFVGPSGCGKTTALRLIAGLDESSGGEIFIGDKEVSHVAAKDRDIAMVFQSYALYPHMSVRENMSFGLRLRLLGSIFRRVSHPREVARLNQEIARRIDEAAELLGLQGLLERRPRELSGGQRQRVALGRAIVREPQVFLMDEPLSNLDAKLRVQTRAELIRLHRRLGITTIYVTHDQTEAMTMGDRIAVMKDGVLQQAADPRELYDRPANAFVASFIGSPPMNLLRLPVSDGKALLGEAEIPAPTERGEVIVGIRPESFKLEGTGIGLCATVDVVEPLGSTKTVMMHLAGHPVTALMESDAPTMEGEDLALKVRPESVQFFDAETEEAIR